MKRSLQVANIQTILLWNKIRAVIDKHQSELFDQNQTFNTQLAAAILTHSSIEAEDTYCFFDMIFEIS